MEHIREPLLEERQYRAQRKGSMFSTEQTTTPLLEERQSGAQRAGKNQNTTPTPPTTSLAEGPLLKGEDYCLRAEQLLKKRQWSSAQKILQRGLLEVEKKTKAYHLLGLALYHQGFFQTALIQLQKACEKEPEPEYLLNLSIALNELGHYKDAKKAYERVLHLQNQSREQSWKEEVTKRHNRTAEAYLKNNQLKSALKEYIKGFQMHQTSYARLQIARLFWKLKHKQTAFKYLKSFIGSDPQNIPARLLLAEWFFESKQIAQAINEWESVLNQDPQNQEAHDCLLKTQQLTECF